jgi:hypothetical protein
MNPADPVFSLGRRLLAHGRYQLNCNTIWAVIYTATLITACPAHPSYDVLMLTTTGEAEDESVSKTANLPDQLRPYLKEIDSTIDTLPSYPVRENRLDVKWESGHCRRVALEEGRF